MPNWLQHIRVSPQPPMQLSQRPRTQFMLAQQGWSTSHAAIFGAHVRLPPSSATPPPPIPPPDAELPPALPPALALVPPPEDALPPAVALPPDEDVPPAVALPPALAPPPDDTLPPALAPPPDDALPPALPPARALPPSTPPSSQGHRPAHSSSYRASKRPQSQPGPATIAALARRSSEKRVTRSPYLYSVEDQRAAIPTWTPCRMIDRAVRVEVLRRGLKARTSRSPSRGWGRQRP